MKLTLTSIENKLLALQSKVSKEIFIYDFLLVYEQPKSSITRLKKGNLNFSNEPGEVYWKKKIFYKETNQELFDSSITKFKDINDVRFVIITDFNRFYSIDKKLNKTLDINFKDIYKSYDFFLPLTNIERKTFKDFESTIDVKATKNLGKLYYTILNDNYKNITKENLNNFFARLVFCYFAEDTKIFKKDLFTENLKNITKEDGSDLAAYFERIFSVLDTSDHKRKNLPSYLIEFPYVNGKLFIDKFDLPNFSKASRNMIIDNAHLDWSEINPDIFGSMIQQIVRGDEIDEYGRHYTTVENIMKVIEPLFLDSLYEDFEKSLGSQKKLNNLLDRISKIKIFDPACGSGNFLIVSFRELRKLEMEILKEKGSFPETKISLQNFYGIETDDFAHEIAKLSLWLTEHQMNLQFFKEFGTYINTLPLKSVANIVHGNSCKISWFDVCPNNKEDEIYVIGNPPFHGSNDQNELQKEDIKNVFSKEFKLFKSLDYVCCWFWLGSKYILNSKAELALVSTNSICQGSHVPILWPNINKLKIEKRFVYRKFKWKNNAPNPATPFVIIVGLRNSKKGPKKIFDGEYVNEVKFINSYLLPAQEIIIDKRKKPLSDFLPMPKGNMPYGKGLIISKEKERKEVLNKYPNSKKFIKELVGADEFVQRTKRWCYWIKDEDLNEALKIPPIKKGIEINRKSRENSTDEGGKKLAKRSHQFREIRETKKNSLIVPLTVTENREYFPIGYISKKVIATNLVGIIYESEPFMFSILSSRMHYIWIEISCGGKGGGVRYSMDLGYNTFPFPVISENTKKELEKNFYNIELIRENYSNKTYEELYNPKKMPDKLKNALIKNDQMVEKCYQDEPFTNDIDRLKHLLKLYLNMTGNLKRENEYFDF